MKTSCRRTIQAVLPVMLMLLAVEVPSQVASNPAEWSFGDVFVAIGNGSYQVYHSANPAANKPSYTLVQTINDGLGGATAGCTFDSAYRLFGTNSDNTEVDQYSIDEGHGLANQFSTGATTGFRQNQSVVFDGQGNSYVGFADTNSSITGGGLEFYNHAGVFQRSFAPTIENKGVDWID